MPGRYGRQTASRAVSSTEQPPATLEQSALRSSLQRSGVVSASSGQLHVAVSSDTRAVTYTEQYPAINSSVDILEQRCLAMAISLAA